jgi:hypothetical protein
LPDIAFNDGNPHGSIPDFLGRNIGAGEKISVRPVSGRDGSRDVVYAFQGYSFAEVIFPYAFERARLID